MSTDFRQPDPWHNLKRYTAARIAQGRVGTSQPLSESLAFKLDHARARDAVHTGLDVAGMVDLFKKSGTDVLTLESRARDRHEYLTRPDLGRRLSEPSLLKLQKLQRETGTSVDHAPAGGSSPAAYDVCLVIADGLSARAVHENAAGLVLGLEGVYRRAGLSLAPLCLVTNGRVAVGDEIGENLHTRLVVMLIGERPGLSSPDSLGIYITYHPRSGTTDEARNCISNIRPGGLPLEAGLAKTAWLTEEALKLNLTGVKLKDRMQPDYKPFGLDDVRASRLKLNS